MQVRQVGLAQAARRGAARLVCAAARAGPERGAARGGRACRRCLATGSARAFAAPRGGVREQWHSIPEPAQRAAIEMAGKCVERRSPREKRPALVGKGWRHTHLRVVAFGTVDKVRPARDTWTWARDTARQECGQTLPPHRITVLWPGLRGCASAMTPSARMHTWGRHEGARIECARDAHWDREECARQPCLSVRFRTYDGASCAASGCGFVRVVDGAPRLHEGTGGGQGRP